MYAQIVAWRDTRVANFFADQWVKGCPKLFERRFKINEYFLPFGTEAGESQGTENMQRVICYYTGLDFPKTKAIKLCSLNLLNICKRQTNQICYV